MPETADQVLGGSCFSQRTIHSWTLNVHKRFHFCWRLRVLSNAARTDSGNLARGEKTLGFKFGSAASESSVVFETENRKLSKIRVGMESVDPNKMAKMSFLRKRRKKRFPKKKRRREIGFQQLFAKKSFTGMTGSGGGGEMARFFNNEARCVLWPRWAAWAVRKIRIGWDEKVSRSTSGYSMLSC